LAKTSISYRCFLWGIFQKGMEKDDSKILQMSQSKIGTIFWHLAEGFRSSYSNLRQRRENGCWLQWEFRKQNSKRRSQQEIFTCSGN